MNLAYFGSGAFGLPTLQALSAHHRIAAIITQPDRPAGRGGKLTPTPIAEWAAQSLPTTPVHKPERIREPHIIDDLRRALAPGGSERIDAWVVIAYGQKLPNALLDGVFAINLHASLLPRWRGAAPINAAILAGDTVTGNSVITLADRMDAGLILAQSSREIDPLITAGELHDALALDGPSLIDHVLTARAQGRTHDSHQDESLATKAPKLSKADDWLDLTASAELCRRRVHGLSPWPGISATLDGTPIKIGRVKSVAPESEQSAPGTLVNADRGVISCGERTALQFLEVQPAGKRMMPWTDFARGRRLSQGAQLVANRRPHLCS